MHLNPTQQGALDELRALGFSLRNERPCGCFDLYPPQVPDIQFGDDPKDDASKIAATQHFWLLPCDTCRIALETLSGRDPEPPALAEREGPFGCTLVQQATGSPGMDAWVTRGIVDGAGDAWFAYLDGDSESPVYPTRQAAIHSVHVYVAAHAAPPEAD